MRPLEVIADIGARFESGAWDSSDVQFLLTLARLSAIEPQHEAAIEQATETLRARRAHISEMIERADQEAADERAEQLAAILRRAAHHSG